MYTRRSQGVSAAGGSTERGRERVGKTGIPNIVVLRRDHECALVPWVSSHVCATEWHEHRESHTFIRAWPCSVRVPPSKGEKLTERKAAETYT